MSVDLFTPLPSYQVLTEVFAFFGQHYRPWPALRGGPHPWFPNEPADFTTVGPPCTDFATRYPFHMGIRYGSAVGGERWYARCLVNFMALRWGIPLVIQDDEERMIFPGWIPNSLPVPQRWDAVDHLGIPYEFRAHQHELSGVLPGDLERIERELVRLNELAKGPTS